MSIDITERLVRARQNESKWTLEYRSKVIDRILKCLPGHYFEFFCEKKDGLWHIDPEEYWVKSGYADGMGSSVIMRTDIPFLAVNSKYSDRLVPELAEYDVEVAVYSNYCVRELSMDKSQFKFIFPNEEWQSAEGEYDENSFSIEDLWYMTV